MVDESDMIMLHPGEGVHREQPEQVLVKSCTKYYKVVKLHT